MTTLKNIPISAISLMPFLAVAIVVSAILMPVSVLASGGAVASPNIYGGSFFDDSGDWGWEPEYEYFNTYQEYEPYYSSNDWNWQPEYEYFNTYQEYEPYYSDLDWGWEPEYEYFNTYQEYEPYYPDYYVNDYYYSDYSYDYGYDYSYDYGYDYNYDYGCGSGCNSGCRSNCNPPPRNDSEPTCSIDADDESLEEGDSTRITWNSNRATSATLSSFGSVNTDGSRTVSPTSDKTYTLTVRDNDGDTDTCSVHISVDEDNNDGNDPWCRLTASDKNVDEGDEVTLEWDTRDVDFASINHGIGRVDEDGGEEDVEVDEDTTFRMTVRDNDGDESTCSVTVRVDDRNNFSDVTFDSGSVNNPPVVYLSDLPYTGIEDITPSMIGFWLALIGLLSVGGYVVFFKRSKVQA